MTVSVVMVGLVTFMLPTPPKGTGRMENIVVKQFVTHSADALNQTNKDSYNVAATQRLTRLSVLRLAFSLPGRVHR